MSVCPRDAFLDFLGNNTQTQIYTQITYPTVLHYYSCLFLYYVFIPCPYVSSGPSLPSCTLHFPILHPHLLQLLRLSPRPSLSLHTSNNSSDHPPLLSLAMSYHVISHDLCIFLLVLCSLDLAAVPPAVPPPGVNFGGLVGLDSR